MSGKKIIDGLEEAAAYAKTDYAAEETRMMHGLREIERDLNAYRKTKAALESAPDIAMYQPDEFYMLYTKWFEVTRSAALMERIRHD